MSYCRFGWYGSQVYVYEGTEGIECCGCGLSEAGFSAACGCCEDDCSEEDGAIAHREAAYEMVLHLREHKKAGHVVPPGVMAELSAEACRWTPERVAHHIRWRWWRLMRKTVCRVFGHPMVSSLPPLDYRHCRRCRADVWFGMTQ